MNPRAAIDRGRASMHDQAMLEDPPRDESIGAAHGSDSEDTL